MEDRETDQALDDAELERVTGGALIPYLPPPIPPQKPIDGSVTK